MERDRTKDLYRRESDSLEGPHEEAEIQRRALRRWKNLAFSKDTCLEKERVRLKVTPRKLGVRLNERLGCKLAWWETTKKGGLTFARIERKTPLLRPPLQSNQSSLCGLHHSGDRGGGGPNGQNVSVKRAADGRRRGKPEDY